MSFRGTVNHALQRAPAIRRNPRREVRGHCEDRTATPALSQVEDSRRIKKTTLQRRPAIRKNANARRAIEQHLEDNSISPPPSPDELRARELIAEVEHVRFPHHAIAGRSHLPPRRSSLEEHELQKLLGLAPLSPSEALDHLELSAEVRNVPPGFKERIFDCCARGLFSTNVAMYYLDVVPRGDAPRRPGQGGNQALLQPVLTEEALAGDSGWIAKAKLGKGGFGTVVLWEKKRRNGPPLRIATKDTLPYYFFADYCSEAHLTRRLNDLGCKNVINVADWVFIPEKTWTDPDGNSTVLEAKHRICYEFAEHGDVIHLVSWYKHKRLIIPEAFLWHLLHSIANALCYCRRGTNEPNPVSEWDQIIHGDLKEDNVFLTTPDPEQNRLYPCAKLGDFGVAYTIGRSVPEVLHFKSTRSYGTVGYRAPEIKERTPGWQTRQLAQHELHSPQADIWSLGATFRESLALLQRYSPVPEYLTNMLEGRGTEIGNTVDGHTIYSKELLSLLSACLLQDPRQRIETYELYKQAKQGMEMWRSRAYAEEATALQRGSPGGCYPSKVLYREEDRRRFADDSTFREAYKEINLRPLAPMMRAKFDPLPRSRLRRNKAEEGRRRGSRRDGAVRNSNRIGKTASAFNGIKNMLEIFRLKSKRK